MFDFDLPEPGLYRTTQPMPGNETQFPAGVLVFIGQPKTGGVKFIVRPADNRRNRSDNSITTVACGKATLPPTDDDRLTLRFGFGMIPWCRIQRRKP
jgi:hypothetical protein